ncbi:MAG: hypothetical protein GX457_17890 [Thermotogaceae bacterium]|nr:hypothetical protein [Thermotogaceae bacterium]
MYPDPEVQDRVAVRVREGKEEREAFEERRERAVEKLMEKYGLVQEGTKSVLRSFYRQRWNDIEEGFTFPTENVYEGNAPLVTVLQAFEAKGTVEKVVLFSRIGYGRPYWISSPRRIGNGMEVEVHTEMGALDGDTWWIRCNY